MNPEQKPVLMPWRTAILDLPVKLEALRSEAKAASREARFSDAYKYNMDLVAQSHTDGNILGEVLGLRFAGVCEYRLGHYQESRRLLEEARDLAQAKNLQLQQLHIANHLGGTSRRLGDLDGALTTLREALEKVRGPDDLEAKARLLGNLGALYDEIGYEGGADDCYARYEELIELFVSLGDSDDLPRLANARALSARAALRRGDLTTAKNKHDDELQLALKSKDQLRIRGAKFHQSKIFLELGLQAQNDHQDGTVHFRRAEESNDEVHREFVTADDRARLADSWHHRGRLYEAQKRWADAYVAWKQAYDLAQEKKLLYRQGESSLALARFCQRWALHGESLYWFQEAAQIHCRQYEPLKQSKRIAKLARARIAELQEVAEKIADEAKRVEREKHESKEIDELIKTITGKTISALSEEKALVAVHEWQKRMREASLVRWRELITPEKFAQLSHQSQSDLVSADLLYHSVVDELPRSALLIAIVAERELRERLFVPLHQLYHDSKPTRPSRRKGRPPAIVDYFCYKSSDNIPIGGAFHALREIIESKDRHTAITFAQEKTRPWHDKLRRIRALDEPIAPIGAGSGMKTFAKLRNHAAHGGEDAVKLDRLTVDAMKRRLFLERPSILATILEVDLRPLIAAKPSS